MPNTIRHSFTTSEISKEEDGHMDKLQTLCTMAPWDVLSNNTKIKARYESAPRLSVAGRLQKMWNLYPFFPYLTKMSLYSISK